MCVLVQEEFGENTKRPRREVDQRMEPKEAKSCSKRKRKGRGEEKKIVIPVKINFGQTCIKKEI